MPSDDLALALDLADLADSVSMPRFGANDLRVTAKSDSSPVTDADHAVEQALRGRLAAERPQDGVLGEEHGATDGGARWVLDPIDGTRNFARAIPVWATLIALERDGVAVCGVVSAPALGHRWWAERGAGAFCDGEPIQVSETEALSRAAVSCAHGDDLAALEPLVWHARGFGDFWQHMLVAAGALDAAVDAALSHWDVAAVAPIVEEAGGRVSGPRGEPAGAGRQLVSSNGRVHDELVAALPDR
ncbi:MAG TPA: inositol monophosphatase family protein [Gaiellales bacterium]|nr:inositol monophosphatase family protein [Gaiellales bacterium]